MALDTRYTTFNNAYMADIDNRILPATPIGLVYPNDGITPLDTEEVKIQKLNEADRELSLASAYDAIIKGLYAFPNMNPDALISNRGYDVLDEMRTMSLYDTPLRMLMYACLYKKWKLLPACPSPQNEQKDGFKKGDYDISMRLLESTHYHLSNIRDRDTDRPTNFMTVLWNMLCAIHNGFSVQEIDWQYNEDGPYKGEWGIKSVTYLRNKSVGFDLDDNLNILNIRAWPMGRLKPMTANGRKDSPFGRQIPVEKCLIYTFDKRDNMPHGNGLARTCYRHYVSIERGMRDWLIMAKRAGGFMEVETDNPKSIKEAAMKIANFEAGGGLVHTSLEKWTDHKGLSGSTDFLANFVDWHCAKIKETFLGQTLTTQIDGKGSYAASNNMVDTQNFFTQNPRGGVEFNITEQLIRRMCRYNGGTEVEHLRPVMSLGAWDVEQRLAEAKLTDVFLKNGILIPRYDRTQIRKDHNLFALDLEQDQELPVDILPDRERAVIDVGSDGLEADPKSASGD